MIEQSTNSVEKFSDPDVSPNVCLNAIPPEMAKRHQWGLWKFVETKNGFTKVPRQTNNLNASSNDPETWSSLEECYSRLMHCQFNKFDGLAYFFAEGDGLFGCDVDGCFDTAGTMDPWAQRILDKFVGVYTECTPSGLGFHIIGKADIPRAFSKHWDLDDHIKRPGIEIYNFRSPRFFTVTGASIGGEIIDCQEAVDWLIANAFPEPLVKPKRTLTNASEGLRTVDENRIEHMLSFVPADDYDVWLQVGMALKRKGYNFDLFDRWSSKSAKYDFDSCLKKWNSLPMQGAISMGKIWYLAEANGWDGSRK